MAGGGDNPRTFAGVTIFLQVLCLILFGVCVDYNSAGVAETDSTTLTEAENRVTWLYPMFQDVHVMIFVGFGFLMTFLHKYAWSSVGYTLFISALTIQLAILIVNFFHMAVEGHWHTIKLTVESLIAGDFACGAVLISFGACLGRLTPTQLAVMAVLELIFYSANEAICVVEVQAVDMGGSMYVHTFGAYFGLAVSLALGVPKNGAKNVENNGSSYTSDMFAMIGTAFLWMFWPSFNGVLAPNANFAKERVVLNTVLALCGSCVMTFALSRLINPGQKFSMVHIQNATLAGGVAVGSSSDLVVGPWASILMGMIAGSVSTFGYVYIQPFLERKIGLLDTCGVHNLHGIPGIIGGIGGAISAACAGSSSYGAAIEEFWGARATRTAAEQGGYQALALFTSLCFSIAGGAITGLILGSSLFDQEENAWHDKTHWELEEGSEGEMDELLDVSKGDTKLEN